MYAHKTWAKPKDKRVAKPNKKNREKTNSISMNESIEMLGMYKAPASNSSLINRQ